MPFCSECGSPMNQGEEFCTVCGTAIKSSVQSAAPVAAGVVLATPQYYGMPTAPMVSSKYAFVVVALCGLTATLFLIAGASTHITRAKDGSNLDTLYGLAHADNVCKKGQEKGNTALAFAIIAAIIAFLSTCTSAAAPLTSSRQLPLYGGIGLGVASIFALIAGAVAVSMYTEPLCDAKSLSTDEQIRIGPGPVLLMLSMLPLFLGVILSVVMRRPWTPEDEVAAAESVNDNTRQTLSKKYAFAVVALCGVVALPLLIIGALSPVFEGTECPSGTYWSKCVPIETTLLNVAYANICQDAKQRGGAGFGIAIVAAAAAAIGAAVSASAPFTSKHNLPIIGGGFLGVGALCALVSGAVTISIYTQDLCGGRSMSSINTISVGPASILQMLAVLPLAGGFVAGMMMKKFQTPAESQQVRFSRATGKKLPSVALLVTSVVALTLLVLAGTTDVFFIHGGYRWYAGVNNYISATSPTILQASKHSACGLEGTRASVALIFLIASGVGTGAALVLGYGALVTDSRRLAMCGGVGQCISGVLSLIGGAAAMSLFTTKMCYSGSISALRGAIRASPILLMVSAFVLLVGGLVALFSLRSKASRSAASGERCTSQPLVSEQHIGYDTSSIGEAQPVTAV